MAMIRATCPDCGDTEMPPADVTAHKRPDGAGTYQFKCRPCKQVVAKPAPADVLDVLIAAGVKCFAVAEPIRYGEEARPFVDAIHNGDITADTFAQYDAKVKAASQGRHPSSQPVRITRFPAALMVGDMVWCETTGRFHAYQSGKELGDGSWIVVCDKVVHHVDDGDTVEIAANPRTAARFNDRLSRRDEGVA